LLISLGLPEAIDLQWVEAFYRGFNAVCETSGGTLIGGDTVGSDRIVINVTAIGECPANHTAGRRNQAQPGDFIVTTGYHGLSQVGLAALQANTSGYVAAKAAHLRPQPRIQEGLALSQQYQRYALMDSSDGLADALLKVAQASGQTLVVDAAKIPVHPEVAAYAASQNADPMQIILYGGEDFQLVATLPEVPTELLAHVHIIGKVEEASNNASGAWLNRNGQREALQLEKTYQHFGQHCGASYT
jgi:thiamine-monophosphate kinase